MVMVMMNLDMDFVVYQIASLLLLWKLPLSSLTEDPVADIHERIWRQSTAWFAK